MLQSGQRIVSPAPPPPGGEISAAALLSELEGHAAKTLIFNYEGRDVLPGYHVTEVKTAAFQALDCSANYETWHETFIQLWDIPQEDERRFMAVGKFLAIIGKVSDAVPFDPNAKLTFEVSDGKSAMQLYRASSIDVEVDTVRVGLTQRPASCKPRDRWLEQQNATTSPCCGPKADARPCCR